MCRFAVLALVLAGLGLTSLVAAEERRVVVLIPSGRGTDPWSEGTQAVIAELAARRYQVVVEASTARALSTLVLELRAAAVRDSTAAAVAVVKDGSTATAYVCTEDDPTIVEVQAQTNEGAVGEGALALRVTEWIRARELTLSPPKKKEAPRLPAPKAETKAEASGPLSASGHPKPLLWLGAGPTFSSGTARALIGTAAFARLPIGLSRVAVDVGLSISVAPSRANTKAGQVDLGARQLSLYLLAEPSSESVASFAAGIGAGAIWLEETAAHAAPGYEGRSDNTYVGLLSLRARASVRSGGLSFVLTVDPGILLPAATVRASGEDLARLGRPWTSISAGVGWAPR